MDNEGRIYTDENGTRWLADGNGHPVKDEYGSMVPPMHSQRDSSPGEFTTYDTSRGHCGLCGRLTCNGGCFK